MGENRGGIYPVLALRACRDAISLVTAVQRYTGQRRMWDAAFSILDVEGLRVRPRGLNWPSPFQPPIPRGTYSGLALGVSTERLEDDTRGVVEELTGRFIGECGLVFDHEWPAEGRPW